MTVTVDLAGYTSDDVTRAQADVSRELAIRAKVYPRWVNERKITQAQADQRIGEMTIACTILERIHAAMARQPELPLASATPPPAVAATAVSPATQSATDLVAIIHDLVVKVSKEGRTEHGWFPCPACGARMNWSIATNGHVCASCNTDGCIRFWE